MIGLAGPVRIAAVGGVVVLVAGAVIVAAGASNPSPSPTPSSLSALASLVGTAPPTISPTLSPTAAPTLPAPSATPPPTPTPCGGRAPSSTAIGAASVESTINWAGYAAVGRKAAVSCVEARWIEPTPTCPSGKGFKVAATWVGIGGWAPKDPLIQVGTYLECSDGVAAHESWFQVYPAQSHSFAAGIDVRDGDEIWASVRYAAGAFTLTIINLTREESWSAVERVSRPLRESADWIVESPAHGCPKACAYWSMPDFGLVRLADAYATINGVRTTIDDTGFRHDRMTMVKSSGLVRARPSGLVAGGTGFTVSWVRP